MQIRLALAGNPNSGKTTLFNAMTGSNQYVGNWPGVTVEKKEGKLKGHPQVTVTDLPGIYSLAPYTLEEVVTRDYLLGERPDVIVDVVDATNLERNLYLTTQLLELGIPVVVALNRMDAVDRAGEKLDAKALSGALGCPVVEISALKGTGLTAAYDMAIRLAHEGAAPAPLQLLPPAAEGAVEQIAQLIAPMVPQERARWYAVKLFEGDEKVGAELASNLAPHLETIAAAVAACEGALDDDGESIVTGARYDYITSIIGRVQKRRRTGLTTSDKIDRVVTHRVLALPIFALVMFLVYYIAIGTVGTWATDWTNDVLFGAAIPSAVESFLLGLGCSEVVVSLVVDGAIGGVGAVLGFVPQMLVLFLLLSVLEDVGYMARVAFLMDRIFRRFGLSGKSFIPMLVGTGCSVPGIMASRTIEQDRDRRMTIMTTSFIPCGAKMPIVGLIAGALFGGSGLVAVSAYFVGVAAVVLSGIILKKTRPFTGEPAPFVMELPTYHIPAPENVLRATWERGWSFIKRAGTVIFLSALVLWFLQGFGVVDGSFQMVEDNNHSLLAVVGTVIAPIFAPLGFGSWQSAVAVFTGLIAKENVVGTMGVLYGFSQVAENGEEIWTALAASFTGLAGYSFLLFNLLCAPCFAAMGAIRREMSSGRWTLFAIGYQCAFAYAMALIVYQLGGLALGQVAFGGGTVFAGVVLAGLLWLVLRRGAGTGSRLSRRERKEVYAA